MHHASIHVTCTSISISITHMDPCMDDRPQSYCGISGSSRSMLFYGCRNSPGPLHPSEPYSATYPCMHACMHAAIIKLNDLPAARCHAAWISPAKRSLSKYRYITLIVTLDCLNTNCETWSTVARGSICRVNSNYPPPPPPPPHPTMLRMLTRRHNISSRPSLRGHVIET